MSVFTVLYLLHCKFNKTLQQLDTHLYTYGLCEQQTGNPRALYKECKTGIPTYLSLSLSLSAPLLRLSGWLSLSCSLGLCLSASLLLGASLSLLGNRGGGGNKACSLRFLKVSFSSVSFSCSLHQDLREHIVVLAFYWTVSITTRNLRSCAIHININITLVPSQKFEQWPECVAGCCKFKPVQMFRMLYMQKVYYAGVCFQADVRRESAKTIVRHR